MTAALTLSELEATNITVKALSEEEFRLLWEELLKVKFNGSLTDKEASTYAECKNKYDRLNSVQRNHAHDYRIESRRRAKQRTSL